MVKISLLGAAFMALSVVARPTNPRRAQNPRRGGLDGTGTGTGNPTTPPTEPTPPKVKFYEQWSDLSAWQKDTGHGYPGGPENWGTGEVQSYATSSDVLSVSGGVLTITPRKVNGEWRSARIETNEFFEPEAGKTFRAEARIKLGSAPESQQAGIWPAFWMLGADYRGNFQNWPGVGEIDILESINGARRAYHVAHCPSCDEPNGIGSNEAMSRGAWHTLTFEIKRSTSTDNWRSETLSWYLDGGLQFQITGSRIGNFDSWKALAYSPRFVLLNVAVGGSFPNAVFGGATPTSQTITNGQGTEMQVEYVKVGHVEDGALW